MLTLSGVQTHIGRYHILHGVDFDVPAGETTMLLGRNGAGKTTTLRTIMGLWQASSGEISLGGERIEALATPTSRAPAIGYVPETMGCSRPHGARKPDPRGARRRHGYDAASTGYSDFSRR